MLVKIYSSAKEKKTLKLSFDFELFLSQPLNDQGGLAWSCDLLFNCICYRIVEIKCDFYLMFAYHAKFTETFSLLLAVKCSPLICSDL